jgi:MerR family transcriptional regulator, copper efflux regulator
VRALVVQALESCARKENGSASETLLTLYLDTRCSLSLMEQLTVGELARRAHVNRETVRYYERRRLLPHASRTISGYRIFTDDALRRLRFIRHAKALGFSLNEIRDLLTLRVNSIDACDSVRERTGAKIADIDKKIDSLQKVKGALCELVDACARHRKSNECPILDSLDANSWFEQDAVRGKTRPMRSSVRSAPKSSSDEN